MSMTSVVYNFTTEEEKDPDIFAEQLQENCFFWLNAFETKL